MRLEDDDHSVRARYDKYKEHLALQHNQLNHIYFDSDKDKLKLSTSAATLKSNFTSFGIDGLGMTEAANVTINDKKYDYTKRYFFPLRKRSL